MRFRTTQNKPSSAKRLSFTSINLNHLHDFFVVAEEMSISRAAKRLFISQPALSNRLRLFEEAIDTRLFDRTESGLKLNQSGTLVLRYARKIFSTTEALIKDLRANQAVSRSEIRIAVCEAAQNPFVIATVKHLFYGSGQSAKRITLRTSPFATALEELKSGQVDLVFSAQPDYGGDIKVLKVLRMPMNLVASVDMAHELDFSSLKKILGVATMFAELGRRKAMFVVPSPGLYIRNEIDQFFDRIRFTPKVSLQADSISAMSRSISMGLGVGLLPLAYISEEVKQNELIAFGPTEGFSQHRLWLLARADDQTFMLDS